jgi:hypothetical protein
MPTQTLGYSEWSSRRIRIPPPTTTTAVAVTITLAASRTDGGSRKNFDIRRSIGFERGDSRSFRPATAIRCCPATLSVSLVVTL